MSDQLLPISASAPELALEQATARISDVPVLVRESWDPDECPADQLPWLAWAFSVDEWNAAWTTAQKRDAIKSSVFVHRHKGTVGAIKSALDALGYDADLIEWHRKEPIADPYTFGVTVTVDQVGIGAAAFDEITSVAEATKNVRSHLWGVDVNAISNGTLYLGAACWMGETVEIASESDAVIVNENAFIG